MLRGDGSRAPPRPRARTGRESAETVLARSPETGARPQAENAGAPNRTYLWALGRRVGRAKFEGGVDAARMLLQNEASGLLERTGAGLARGRVEWDGEEADAELRDGGLWIFDAVAERLALWVADESLETISPLGADGVEVAYAPARGAWSRKSGDPDRRTSSARICL